MARWEIVFFALDALDSILEPSSLFLRLFWYSLIRLNCMLHILLRFWINRNLALSSARTCSNKFLCNTCDYTFVCYSWVLVAQRDQTSIFPTYVLYTWVVHVVLMQWFILLVFPVCVVLLSTWNFQLVTGIFFAFLENVSDTRNCFCEQMNLHSLEHLYIYFVKLTFPKLLIHLSHTRPALPSTKHLQSSPLN